MARIADSGESAERKGGECEGATPRQMTTRWCHCRGRGLNLLVTVLVLESSRLMLDDCACYATVCARTAVARC